MKIYKLIAFELFHVTLAASAAPEFCIKAREHSARFAIGDWTMNYQGWRLVQDQNELTQNYGALQRDYARHKGLRLLAPFKNGWWYLSIATGGALGKAGGTLGACEYAPNGRHLWNGNLTGEYLKIGTSTGWDEWPNGVTVQPSSCAGQPSPTGLFIRQY